LHVGKTVHAVLQSWNMARWKGQNRSLADLSDLFIQSWDEEQLGQEIDWQGEERQDRDQAWKLLETYFQQTCIPADEKPQGVEVRLEADLGKHGASSDHWDYRSCSFWWMHRGFQNHEADT